jgi:hypothetical protein
VIAGVGIIAPARMFCSTILKFFLKINNDICGICQLIKSASDLFTFRPNVDLDTLKIETIFLENSSTFDLRIQV